ncbi:MAG: hypothetical protein EOO43_01170 [Flavobacterium sp.]|nr:MAG: hypothetical protein EOO43_01170 [Flavobacterium sp.]
MESNLPIYQWRKFLNNEYIQEELPASQSFLYPISAPVLGEELRKLSAFFYTGYSCIALPSLNNKLFIELLQWAGLSHLKLNFVTIGSALQYSHSENYKIEMNNLTKGFDSEKEAYKNLLDILENYIFSDSHKDLHSISFKYNYGSTKKVDNFFVVKDIYEAMCLGYDLNANNFQDRKTEILSLTNQYKVSRYSEKIKTDFSQALYYTLSSNFTQKSKLLQFIGSLFHIFQVPTNNNEAIELYETLDDLLISIDIKNFRHYITGRIKLNHD